MEMLQVVEWTPVKIAAAAINTAPRAEQIRPAG